MKTMRDYQGRGPRGPYRQPKSSPVFNLAIAIIRQTIRDSQYDSKPYEPSKHVSLHAATVSRDTDLINQAMREDAREWLRSGQWQEISDRLGVSRDMMYAYIRKSCKWCME